MKNRVIKILLVIFVIVLVVESFFLLKYIDNNKKIESLYDTSTQINNAINQLNKQTLETNFSNKQVDEQLNSLKKEANQNTKDLEAFNSIFTNKDKKALVEKQQKQNQQLITTLTSENTVVQDVDALLAENPYKDNELSKEVSLKDDVSDETQAILSESINNLPQSDKKEVLVSTMEAIKSENQKDKKLIALTFDDGPNDSSTIDVLNTLKANNVKATFFVLGSMVEQYPDTLKRIYNEGHEIGNHTYDHKDLTTVSQDVMKKEILGTNEIIRGVIGVEPTLLRPPYGAYNNAVKEMSGMRIMLWNVDSLDWKNKNTEQTISNIESNVSEGDIILMHDIHPTSAAALDKLIKDLKSQGYSFCKASELPTS